VRRRAIPSFKAVRTSNGDEAMARLSPGALTLRQAPA
jgi:hypothetical protein